MRTTTLLLALLTGLVGCAADPATAGSSARDTGISPPPDRPLPADPDATGTGDGGDASASDADAAGPGTDSGDADGGTEPGGDAGTGGDADTGTDSGMSGDGGDPDTSGDTTADTDSGGADVEPRDTGDGDAGVCAATRAVASEATRPVDIVWVVDGSPSMRDAIERIEANLNGFTASIGSSGLDYRVVMLAADRDYCADARCYSEVCVPPPLSAVAGCPDTNGPRYLHVRQGVHSSDSIDLAMSEFGAYRSFLRPEAVTHVVFVTDDDAGFGPGATEFERFLRDNIRADLSYVQVHSIVDLVDSPLGCGVFDDDCSCGEERGDEYIALSELTGGLVLSVCEDDWSPLFSQLEERVGEGVALPCAYALPTVTAGLEIDRVNVVRITAGGDRETLPNVDDAAGCTAGPAWYYDDASAPTVVLLCPEVCLATSGEVELEFGCRTLKL